MNKSESIKSFAEAMARFQGEVKNPPKSADNPFFKSKYTTLDVLIDTAKPLLNKNGLSYIQSCSGDGSNIIVTTLLMHSSGEWVESDPLTLKADKATAQGAGSAITYARRYALAAALGLASDEDDDGNAATGKDNNVAPYGNKSKDTGHAKCTNGQIVELFKVSEVNKQKNPDFDFFKLLSSLANEKKISNQYPYADKDKTKINWTIADYEAIKKVILT